MTVGDAVKTGVVQESLGKVAIIPWPVQREASR
jgi:hypothetical protein